MKSTASTHFSQKNNRNVVRDSKKAAKVDLSSIIKLHKTPSQLLEYEQYLVKSIASCKSSIQVMMPNLHAVEKYEEIVDKCRILNEELESTKELSMSINNRFEAVKEQRRVLFQSCYKHVSESLSVIYKDLTKSSRNPLGGNAYLTLSDSSNSTSSNVTDEPYLGGIRYTAMPPMKRFRYYTY